MFLHHLSCQILALFERQINTFQKKNVKPTESF